MLTCFIHKPPSHFYDDYRKTFDLNSFSVIKVIIDAIFMFFFS